MATSSDPLQDTLNDLRLSRADLEDLFSDNQQGADNILSNDIAYGGSAADQYRRFGTFLTPDALADFFNKVLNESYRLMGQGGNGNQLQTFLSRLDRHGTVITPLNSMNYGFTFITRPRLNLTSPNLRQNPILHTLNANDENSVAFMIRALLDTRLSTGSDLILDYGNASQLKNEEVMDFGQKCLLSGLVDARNPFFIPLCNGLKGLSGFPDFNIEVETTEGDFHSGDFTFAKGSDMNNRTQELSLEFRDVQGSIILSCIYYWCLYMALQAKGVVMAYPDDIYQQRLNYTVSIYRFVMDTTRRNILWWAKATGCFPKSAPIGALFNVNQSEVTISSAANFSVPFTANDIKVNDPGIILDFNRLMKRYCPTIDTEAFYDVETDNDMTAGLNFIGLPYIEDTATGLKLVWRTDSNYVASAGLANGLNLDTLQPEDETEWDNLTIATENARITELNRIISAIQSGQGSVDDESRTTLAEDLANNVIGPGRPT